MGHGIWETSTHDWRPAGKMFAIVGLKDSSGRRFGRTLTKDARDVRRSVTIRAKDTRPLHSSMEYGVCEFVFFLHKQKSKLSFSEW